MKINEFKVMILVRCLHQFIAKSDMWFFEHIKLKYYDLKVFINHKRLLHRMQYSEKYLSDINYIIPCKYQWLCEAGKNMYIAKLRDKEGVIDDKENIIIPFDYDWISYCRENKFVAEKDEKHGCIDINKKIVLDFVYDFLIATEFSQGLLNVWIDTENDLLCGCIDENGNYVIRPDKYKDIGSFEKCGLADASIDDRTYGVINKQGEVIIDFKYRYIQFEKDYIVGETMFLHRKKCFDFEGNPIKKPCKKHNKKENSKYEILSYRNKEGKYGFYKHTSFGNFSIIEPTFDHVGLRVSDDGYVTVCRNGKYGLIKIDRN